jgi:hypothetical protein
MADEVHVGDIGTTIELTLLDGAAAVDVSSATATKNILLTDPLGALHTKGASFTTDGTDGKVKWVTTAVGDFDLAGTWKVQAYVENTSPVWKGHSAKGEFQVHDVLT